ncbi:hypothetical protein KAT92_01070, partial [Candidatus Babeliales bacterium]|nr:hypothetical protein [Candidatus Babeliales bacterium]
YDHKAIEFKAITRFKTTWGKIGANGRTEYNDEFKIVDAAYGGHSHDSSKPLLWMKEAWLKASLSAILSDKPASDRLHFVKLGMFPFQLGRGIALGSFYGVSKKILALYSHSPDYYSPGILLTGELAKDVLWYDLYYSKLEEKSASFGDTFNSVKEKVIGRSATPWRGVAKDNDLYAGRLKIKPIDNETQGTLDLEPYIYYNEASDQKVELPADSKSILGAVGGSAEYKYKNFEVGTEVAFNYGHETLFHIDRNRVIFKMDKYENSVGDAETVESLREVFSKILYEEEIKANFHGKNVIVNSTTKTIVGNYNATSVGAVDNGQAWTPSPADPNSVAEYKNASNRYRPGYKNKYRGWMGVLDASYFFENADLKIAGALGYASGDKNPHQDTVNKSYKGFVGLHELYDGNRVPSVFMLDSRSIKRPLTFIAAGGTTNDDPLFTDFKYVGLGATFTPKALKEHNFSLNPNMLFFWKAHGTKKYDTTIEDENGKTVGGVSPTEDASKFLGIEFNIKTKYDLLKDLCLKGDFAFFLPGSYYNDVKGAPMDTDLFAKLEEADKQGIDSSTYRLGDDAAFYCKIVLEYSF